MIRHRAIFWVSLLFALAAVIFGFARHHSREMELAHRQEKTGRSETLWNGPSDQGSTKRSERERSSTPNTKVREISISNDHLERFLEKMGRAPDAIAFVELVRKHSLNNPLEYLEELRAHPHSAQSPMACMLLTIKLEDVADRLQWAQQFMQIEPDNRLAKLCLAKALAESGRAAEAKELLVKAAESASITHESDFVQNFDAFEGILPEEDVNLLVLQTGNRWHNQIDTEIFGRVFDLVDFWNSSTNDPDEAVALFSTCYSSYMDHREGDGKYGIMRGTTGYNEILKALDRAPEHIRSSESFSSLSKQIRKECDEQRAIRSHQRETNLSGTETQIEQAALQFRQAVNE